MIIKNISLWPYNVNGKKFEPGEQMVVQDDLGNWLVSIGAVEGVKVKISED